LAFGPNGTELTINQWLVACRPEDRMLTTVKRCRLSRIPKFRDRSRFPSDGVRSR